MLETMSRIFRKPKPILAMVHTGPTPGAPGRPTRCSIVFRPLSATGSISNFSAMADPTT